MSILVGNGPTHLQTLSLDKVWDSNSFEETPLERGVSWKSSRGKKESSSGKKGSDLHELKAREWISSESRLFRGGVMLMVSLTGISPPQRSPANRVRKSALRNGDASDYRVSSRSGTMIVEPIVVSIASRR
ncbi:hypothetical protein K0M31_016665 [Melipona bicolor]|uniref:Uncharacterized protein n=1 Tax=Melipona bicolor TaxID=60889 RepID=A0AA40FEC9_9HYME|nr:hypothetical protein K0M31_016665 [Melipona bicolor]